MLRILFFGRLREELDCNQLDIPVADGGPDLDALQAHLCGIRGGKWRETLGAPNIIRALNQQMVQGNARIEDGDEIAFFPPVTGG